MYYYVINIVNTEILLFAKTTLKMLRLTAIRNTYSSSALTRILLHSPPSTSFTSTSSSSSFFIPSVPSGSTPPYDLIFLHSNVDAVKAENKTHKTFMAPVPPVAPAASCVRLQAPDGAQVLSALKEYIFIVQTHDDHDVH